MGISAQQRFLDLISCMQALLLLGWLGSCTLLVRLHTAAAHPTPHCFICSTVKVCSARFEFCLSFACVNLAMASAEHYYAA
jgi:hypothetical protein